MSNCLVQDQDGCSVGPDLGPNCLQRLSADDKVATSNKRVNSLLTHIYKYFRDLADVNIQTDELLVSDEAVQSYRYVDEAVSINFPEDSEGILTYHILP